MPVDPSTIEKWALQPEMGSWLEYDRYRRPQVGWAVAVSPFPESHEIAHTCRLLDRLAIPVEALGG